ncbi:MAG: hypothetical protein LBT46_09775 [Planctomycetaceae bacterium]|nr:hypothetical protein [Planctomycetaceae bacterium]
MTRIQKTLYVLGSFLLWSPIFLLFAYMGADMGRIGPITDIDAQMAAEKRKKAEEEEKSKDDNAS